jgi:RNA polymerase sigma factor (sigma-70 family)
MYDGANVQVSERERFILACQPIIEQEVCKVGRRCCHLAQEDLYAEAMLHVVEYADQLMAAREPGAYVRITVRRLLNRYVWEHDSLIRTPVPHGRGRPVVSSHMCMSLDMPVDPSCGDSVVLGDLLAGPGQENEAGAQFLRQALEKLTEQQRAVLLARFGTPGARLRSFRAIAQEAGLSLGLVHKIVQEALEVLRYELAGEVTA